MMQNKIFILYFISLFLLNGCLGSKAPITCSEISNNYAKYDYIEKPIILDTAKGYEELAEYIFFYDSIDKFNEDIDTYFLYLELLKVKKIDKPYLNKYCRNISSTIHESNTTFMLNRLKKIKNSWTEDYGNKIDETLKNKIKFNVLDGCQSFASKLMKYIIIYNGMDNEIYIEMKNTYQDCLVLKKKKNIK